MTYKFLATIFQTDVDVIKLFLFFGWHNFFTSYFTSFEMKMAKQNKNKLLFSKPPKILGGFFKLMTQQLILRSAKSPKDITGNSSIFRP